MAKTKAVQVALIACFVSDQLQLDRLDLDNPTHGKIHRAVRLLA
jgi:hypothetical protein